MSFKKIEGYSSLVRTHESQSRKLKSAENDLRHFADHVLERFDPQVSLIISRE